MLTVFPVLGCLGCSVPQVQYETLGPAPAPLEATDATLFLVGDAGEANASSAAVLAHLGVEVEAAARTGDPVVVAFLGDNIYDIGARPSFVEEDLPILQAQIEPLGRRDNVRGVFVPGNHDWAQGATTTVARTALRFQQEWLNQLADGRRVELRPEGGCPGPSTVDVGASLHLVFLDSEWLLRAPTDTCGSSDDFYDRLGEDLRRNRDRTVVVMAHHPMVSGGPHGGNVSPLAQVPLVSYLARRAGVNVQDLSSGAYSEMIERLRATFDSGRTTPLVFAGGHDHNLQVIRTEGFGMPAYQLVSGAGSKSSNARRVEGTRYSTNRNGYMRLDFGNFGARLIVYSQTGEDGAVLPVFSCLLTESGTSAVCPEAAIVGPSQR
jgi:hypothetical protein